MADQSTERFDGFLLAMAQQHRGIEPLLSSLFGFLRRKTDFLTGASPETVEATVLRTLREQQQLAVKGKAQQAAARSAAAQQKAAQKAAQKATSSASSPGGVTEILRTDLPKIIDAESVSESEPSRTAASSEAAPASGAGAASASDGASAPSSSGEEQGEGKRTGLEPNSGNGLDLATYSWTQSLKDVTVAVPVRAGVRGKDVEVSWEGGELSVGVRGEDPVLAGVLPHAVEEDDCVWTLEDAEGGAGQGRVVTVHLAKVNRLEWWGSPIKGEPQVDMQKVEPENSRLEDLDPETAKTVRKMQFDMRAKATGGMTSDQLEKQAALERFKRMRPDLDFSNAKISM